MELYEDIFVASNGSPFSSYKEACVYKEKLEAGLGGKKYEVFNFSGGFAVRPLIKESIESEISVNEHEIIARSSENVESELQVDKEQRNFEKTILRPSILSEVKLLLGFAFCLILLIGLIVLHIAEVNGLFVLPEQLMILKGKIYYFIYAAVVVSLIISLKLWYQVYRKRYVITSKTISVITGILSRDEIEINLKDVRNIEIEQNIFERVISIGNLSFATAGTSGVEVVFHGVSKPMQHKKTIKDLM